MDIIEWFASSPLPAARALRRFASFGLSLADMPLGLSSVADERFQSGRPSTRPSRRAGYARHLDHGEIRSVRGR